jgi:hypothetical protein
MAILGLGFLAGLQPLEKAIAPKRSKRGMYFIQKVRVHFAVAKYSFLGKKEEECLKNEAQSPL